MFLEILPATVPLLFITLPIHHIAYSCPDSVNKRANLPILLCTSEAAFNCLFPQTFGAARWKRNPKGKKPFE